MIKDYSQTGEQEFIERFFNGYVGTYLEIGAFDGITMSNTLRLLELGWHAVAVEASPPTFLKLKDNYEKNNYLNNCQIINKALVPKYWQKDLIFYESFCEFGKDIQTVGLGTFSKSHLAKYPWITDIRQIQVETIKTETFFTQYGTDFDFVSIDVEELNFELALDIDWNQFINLKLICIEADIQDYRFFNFFEHFDFEFLEQRGANLFFTKSHRSTKQGLNIT
jgi:FkbM family methyltransferase